MNPQGNFSVQTDTIKTKQLCNFSMLLVLATRMTDTKLLNEYLPGIC